MTDKQVQSCAAAMLTELERQAEASKSPSLYVEGERLDDVLVDGHVDLIAVARAALAASQTASCVEAREQRTITDEEAKALARQIDAALQVAAGAANDLSRAGYQIDIGFTSINMTTLSDAKRVDCVVAALGPLRRLVT